MKIARLKIIDEFKQFAVKGNVIDLAVGVVIGTAFNKIVTSLVQDLITPPLGYILQGIKFTDLKITLKEAAVDSGRVVEAVTLNYGNFLQTILDFLIVSFSIFLAIKVINRLRELRKREEKKEAAPPHVDEQIELLKEIRDLLKGKPLP